MLDKYLNKIINSDSAMILQQLPTDAENLIILTDVPYGKNASKGTNGFGSANNRKYKDTWDSEKLDDIYFSEMKRVAQNVIIFGYNYYADILGNTNCVIEWDKVGEVQFNNPFADFELAYTNFNKVAKKYIVKQQGFVKDSKDEVIHPTQKPTELFERIIKDFTKPTDIILDPFSGSGTTAIAAMRTGRNFICIEKEKHYCTLAEERIKNEKRKMAEICYTNDLALFNNVSENTA